MSEGGTIKLGSGRPGRSGRETLDMSPADTSEGRELCRDSLFGSTFLVTKRGGFSCAFGWVA